MSIRTPDIYQHADLGLKQRAADRLTVTVMLTLLDGIRWSPGRPWVYAYVKDDIFEYRLAFDQLDDFDVTRLTALVGAGTAPLVTRKSSSSPTARRPASPRRERPGAAVP